MGFRSGLPFVQGWPWTAENANDRRRESPRRCGCRVRRTGRDSAESGVRAVVEDPHRASCRCARCRAVRSASSMSTKWGASFGIANRGRATIGMRAGVDRRSYPRDGASHKSPSPCAASRSRFRHRSTGTTGRPLRNHRQRERLAEPQPIWRLSEVDTACRPDALNVSAERHQVEVGLEDLSLGIACLEPHGREHLSQFSDRCFRVQAVGQPCKLHRDRRPALSNAADVGAKAPLTSASGLTPACQ